MARRQFDGAAGYSTGRSTRATGSIRRDPARRQIALRENAALRRFGPTAATPSEMRQAGSMLRRRVSNGIGQNTTARAGPLLAQEDIRGDGEVSQLRRKGTPRRANSGRAREDRAVTQGQLAAIRGGCCQLCSPEASLIGFPAAFGEIDPD
jgi:hypothetical protein